MGKRSRHRTVAGPLHDVRYIWDLPDELAKVVRPMVERFSWLLPTWAHAVLVTYSPDTAKGQGSTDCDMHYRQATITLHPGFIELETQRRREVVVHELLHVVHWPTRLAVARIIGALRTLNKVMADTLESVYDDAEDAVIQDETLAILGGHHTHDRGTRGR